MEETIKRKEEEIDQKEEEIDRKEEEKDELFCANICLRAEAEERLETVAELEKEVQELKSKNNNLLTYLRLANIREQEFREEN